MIPDTLLNLGLSQKEASVYLALLELGEASVLKIARKSNIKRPTCYVLLRSLEEKGFASRILRAKKTLFSAQHPKKLVTEAELRLKELNEAMPQLESLLHNEEDRPRVKMYEGKEELDRAYDEWFVVKGEALYISTFKLSIEVFPKTFRKVGYAPLSPGFSVRELIDESEEARKYAKEVSGPYRQVRFIPKELLPFEADIGIFGNHTLITSVKKEYFTVDIESKEIARAFRTIFEVLWRAAKEYGIVK